MQTEKYFPYYYGMVLYLIYAAIKELVQAFLYSTMFLGEIAVYTGFILLILMYTGMFGWLIRSKDHLPSIPVWLAIPVVLSDILAGLLTFGSSLVLFYSRGTNGDMTLWVTGNQYIGIGWLFVLFTTLFILMSIDKGKPFRDAATGFLALYIWFQLPALLSKINYFIILDYDWPVWISFIIYIIPYVCLTGMILMNKRLIPDWGRWLNIVALMAFFLPNFIVYLFHPSGSYSIDSDISTKLQYVQYIPSIAISLPFNFIIAVIVFYRYFNMRVSGWKEETNTLN